MFKKFITLSIAFVLIFNTIQATITLPSLITNNMVLQQNQLVTIWGWTTNATESIKVNGSWNTDSATVTAAGGAWKVQLQTPSYGGPYTLCIKGTETILISNVLIGEVWLASGQSNMEMPVDSISASFRGDLNYRQRIASANFPTIRMFTVPKVTATTVQEK
ncbi:MAG: sialate O-acetylesterase, partial [Bacteroidia bacterium]|nr:sialate O-acetylesterase [Bacteroidia bacterium]